MYLKFTFLLVIAPLLAFAFPESPRVISGGLALQREGNTLYIEASHGAIIDWKDFSIGPDEVVEIGVPDDSCCICCKVSGGSSRITGKLISRGRILLIDPDGFHIDPMASICCAELILSTSDLSGKREVPLSAVNVRGERNLTKDGRVKFKYAISIPKGKVWLDE